MAISHSPPLLVFILPLLFLLASSSLPHSTSQTITQQQQLQLQEKQTLLQLKSDWGNRLSLSTWNSTAANHCNWGGITCTNSSVTGISLRLHNLTKPIPPSICDLQNLSSIDLYYNYLSGEFPTVLYRCSNLESLELAQNLFVGKLPADIHRLSPKLTYLSLFENNFSGDVPQSIGRLPALQMLLLHCNLLNGSYPAEIGDLYDLRKLSLAYNPFNPAPIPPQFGNLTKLKSLWMTQVHAIGEIPDTFQKLKEIEYFDLSWNNMTGTIPDWIWTLPKLTNVYLYANKFSGEINRTISALSLVEIDVSENLLNGPMPDDLGKLTNLTVLVMYINRLSGAIPASVGLLPVLHDLRLFNNSLSGALPPELGKHSELQNLEVNNNGLSGKLPEGLCSREALTSVVLFNNNMSGGVPDSLANCYTLGNIQLYGNKFSGEFPNTIWNAEDLTTVMIHNNAFSGTIPDRLPWSLTRLEIQNNKFSGTIPSSGGRLQVFKASNNLFSGKIPSNLAGMLQLSVLFLDGNRISGSIPLGILVLTLLTELNLSSNRLTGEIPVTMGSLPVLTLLDLSDNELSGLIPPQLGNLKLSFLNVSCNELSGPIPALLQNQAYDRSFLSNLGLCSSLNIITNLRACSNRSDGLTKFRRSLFIMIMLIGGLLLLGTAVVGTLMVRVYLERKKDGPDLAAWKVTPFHHLDFTEESIIRGLTEDRLIGRGGSGKVYRIELGPENTVAVKKIWNERKFGAKLEKQFQAEVQILSSIRHTNIVKLFCCISSSDSKLLVYEYMENKSLDMWLHGQVGASAPLHWPMRLDIAIGAAQGLCYMHHDCSAPIVHRDVKSSNILLDSEFKAKIADFGLAQILVKPGEPNSVSGIVGTFGYMAPECAYARRINEKMDVFSFGVVLLELTTGQRANKEGGDENLAQWLWRHYAEGGRLIDVIDVKIRDPAYFDEVGEVLKIGLMCTATNPSDRPSMKEVLKQLMQCDRTNGVRNMLRNEHDTAPFLQIKMGSRRKSLSDTIEDEREDLCVHVVPV